MIFNSVTFFVFFIIVFVLFWFVLRSNKQYQNILLLIASYVFYGWWDWRFLSLILLSTLVDFYVGNALNRSGVVKQRKFLLGISLVFNIGLLGYFKYYNFFVESWIDAWAAFGITMHSSTLQIILPVGISFYTFQTLSYTIDIYRKEMVPTQNFINFATFVAFFPQLVAGPIERAKHLLPQFAKHRKFNYEQAKSGLHLVIWGLFKKIVIADTCAIYANSIFGSYEHMNTLSLFLGAFYFAFQIYCDFSGYSDIAIGISRMLGFNLMKNFNYPYFSRDIAEFWRRWHISLSTWFRDYLYIPLGGSRVSRSKQTRNVFVVFLVSGFWHGANWTFIFWGFIHAVFFLPLLLGKRNRKYLDQISENNQFLSIKEFFQVVSTFSLVMLAWVFFRAENVYTALLYIKRMFMFESFSFEFLSIERYNVEISVLLLSFICFEWFHRKFEHPFIGRFKWHKIVAVILLLLTLGVYSDYQQFIYFQF